MFGWTRTGSASVVLAIVVMAAVCGCGGGGGGNSSRCGQQQQTLKEILRENDKLLICKLYAHLLSRFFLNKHLINS